MAPTGRSRRQTRRRIAQLLDRPELSAEGLTVSEIARTFGRTGGSLTSVLKGMRTDGQIEPVAGAQKAFRLTPLGRSDLTELESSVVGVVAPGDRLLLIVDEGHGLALQAQRVLSADLEIAWSARLDGTALALLVIPAGKVAAENRLHDDLGRTGVRVIRGHVAQIGPAALGATAPEQPQLPRGPAV
jgi:DNA-binding MarR family transcriptional regulator